MSNHSPLPTEVAQALQRAMDQGVLPRELLAAITNATNDAEVNCPFCGSTMLSDHHLQTATDEGHDDLHDGRKFVQCGNCCAQGPLVVAGMEYVAFARRKLGKFYVHAQDPRNFGDEPELAGFSVKVPVAGYDTDQEIAFDLTHAQAHTLANTLNEHR